MTKPTSPNATALLALVLRWRRGVIFFSLIGSICFATTTAFLLRFEFSIPKPEFQHLLAAICVALVVKLPVFYYTRTNRGWFISTGLEDLVRILISSMIGSILFSLVLWLNFGNSFPRSVYVLDGLFTVAILSAQRIGIRIIREARVRRVERHKNILIYGVGRAGMALARELDQNPFLNSRVVGFLDDNPNLTDELALGIPVFPGGENAKTVVENLGDQDIEVSEILIATPSADPKQMSRIIASCHDTGLPCRILPAMTDLLDGHHLRAQVRDIQLEDLLPRETIALEANAIRDSLVDKCVMITGAAGSIGSELASRVAEFMPRKLILFDFAESQLYFIDQRLRAEGSTRQICAIGNIRDVAQLESIVQEHGVETIFHAAAYKHVPLMEAHVVQAAINNILGTFNVAQVAYRYGVSNFTLISSDKAVNPTSVMGATKRAAELIVSSFPSTPTKFNSVRFGNVLGSNGSVVPLFQAQIARGGPVTVTHPDITRFFMTIREAAQLVLQASTMAKGGEVFVLDMGQPVRIHDLALNMVRLAGLKPGIDIKIQFTGLRPGEKLFEELIAKGERILPTHHEKIKIFKGPLPDRKEIMGWVNDLCVIAATKNDHDIIRHLAELIPEYNVSSQWDDAVHYAGGVVSSGAGERLESFNRPNA